MSALWAQCCTAQDQHAQPSPSDPHVRDSAGSQVKIIDTSGFCR
jgi:hypothetical protein